MNNLKFKTLTEKQEVETFVSGFENRTNVRLPDSYISQGSIVGVFLQEKMVAGYMLVTKPGFRSLLFVPDAIKKSNSLLQNEESEFMEVNGLWISPALKKPSHQMRVWFHLVWKIFSCRKNYVLLMRNLNNRSMKRFMAMSCPEKIFEGEPMKMAGYNTHELIQVGYTTRWKLLMNSHKYLYELFRRIQKSNDFSRQSLVVKSLRESYSNVNG